MTSTFLVALDVFDTDLLLTAQDIQDALTQHGLEVISVKPWARASLPSPSLPFGQTPSVPTPPVVPGI